MMQRRKIGRTGLEVTEFGFGAAPIGNLYRAITDEQSEATVDAAWDGGIRYFDTAPHYGLGLSERRLGRALAGYPRSEFTVSTKVGRLLAPNPAPTGSDLEAGGFDVADDLHRVRDYTRDGVLRSIESSLARLGLDRIDVVYVHDPEDHMDEALDYAFPALAELRDQGVVDAVGAGMNYVEPLRRIVAEADVDAVMVAGRYTLIDRSAAPLLDDCRARDVSVVAAAPFNSGLLARDDAPYDYRAPVPDEVARVRALREAAVRHGVAPVAAALQFPLRHPSVERVVAGMRTPAEVSANTRAMREQVPEAYWREVG